MSFVAACSAQGQAGGPLRSDAVVTPGDGVDGDGSNNSDEASLGPDDSHDDSDDARGDSDREDGDGGDSGSADSDGDRDTTTDSDAGDGDAQGDGGSLPPTLFTDFNNPTADETLWQKRMASGSSISYAVSDASTSDGFVAELLFAGDDALGPADRVGPSSATQIATQALLGFGTYRARVSLAVCDESEELVSGIFVYDNDGTDQNSNGLPDNTEIDFEFVCATPSIVLLTTWTDYQESPESFIKWSRAIDFQTGKWAESPSDHQYGLGAWQGPVTSFLHPEFPEAGAYYELGFEWLADGLRFFMVLDGAEVTLWELSQSSYIPQRDARFMVNLWHPRYHWFLAGEADYPGEDAFARVDWVKYWAAAQ